MQSVKLINVFAHFVVRQFEKVDLPPTDPRRFRLEVLFSPGSVDDFDQIDFQTHSRPMQDYISLHHQLQMGVLLEFLDTLFGL